MKIFNLTLLIISSFILLIFFLIYSKQLNNKELSQNLNVEIKEENFTNSNIIKDIKYTSKDLQGNEYIILAKEGEVDLNNTDVIFLKKVNAYIKMIKKNETITVFSDFGKYNTINYDTIFSKNVRIKYIDNNITSDYLDFSMLENKLIISKNVIYTNPENILKADVIELNTVTKDTKIFMHNIKKKVNIESRD